MVKKQNSGGVVGKQCNRCKPEQRVTPTPTARLPADRRTTVKTMESANLEGQFATFQSNLLASINVRTQPLPS